MIANSLTFYLREGKYIFYSFFGDGYRIRATTGIGVKNEAEYNKLPKEKKNKLDWLRILVDKHISECKLADKPITEISIRNLIADDIGGVVRIVNIKLVELVNRYREEAIKGTVTTSKGKIFSDSTIKLQKVIIKKLRNDKIGEIAVNRLTELDIRAFINRLTHSHIYGKQDYEKSSKNGVTTYINQIACILSATYDLGWHSNDLAKRITFTSSGETIDYAVYYSIQELQKLYQFELLGDEAEIRDVFVFGCFTCLRHSDYYQTDYKKAVRGSELIIKLQKKSNQVNIPLHPIAVEILEKYDYSIPKIPMRDFNPEIKKVVEKAGFDERVLFTRTHGGKLIREYKEKWQLTSSHTMRRSFATNALKSGMKEWVIMAIGGWKSEAAFKKYKRMSEEDVRDAANDSEFYKVRL